MKQITDEIIAILKNHDLTAQQSNEVIGNVYQIISDAVHDGQDEREAMKLTALLQ